MSFGGPELLIASAFLILLSCTVPVVIAAQRFGIGQRWWAIVPLGNIVTLVRASGLPKIILFAFVVPVLNLLAWSACWAAIAQRGGRSRFWGYLTFIPGLSLLVPWVIAFLITAPSDPATRQAQYVAGREAVDSHTAAAVWELRPDGVWMRSDSPGRWVEAGHSKPYRPVTLPFVFSAGLAVFVSLAAVWYDLTYTHLVLRPETSGLDHEISVLRRKISRLERQQSSDISGLESLQRHRAAELAVSAWIASQVQGGRLAQSAVPAKYESCLNWAMGTSADLVFAQAC